MNSNTLFRLISALLIATYLRAASPTTRPCTPADLDGVYQMAQFRETPAANLTLQVQSAPYHILAFYPSAKWAAQAFNVTPTSPDAVDKYLQPQMRKGQTYSLEPDGRLTLTRGKTIQFAERV